MRFTSHDQQIDFDDGSGFESYTPFGGLDASAVQMVEGIEATNRDVRGVITSDAITEEDLRSGRLRGGTVVEHVVDWRFPHAGFFRRFKYDIREVEFTGEIWQANLDHFATRLQRTSGEYLTRPCRADLYDTRCGVDRSSFEVLSVTIASVDSTEPRRKFNANTGALPSQSDGYYELGEVTWLSGENSQRGIVSECLVYTDATRTIELYETTPFDISTSDTFNIAAGCDKLSTTCNTKFSNLDNYRGNHLMPRTDAVLKTAGTY